MRGGSGRRVIFDADSHYVQKISRYMSNVAPRNNSPLSLARMDARGAVIRFRCRYCNVY